MGNRSKNNPVSQKPRIQKDKSPKWDWRNALLLAIVSSILASLIMMFVLEPLRDYIFSSFEKLNIASVNVRNVPQNYNSESKLLNFNHETDYFSDYVENHINFTGDKDVIIDKIQLKNVKYNKYEYIDFGISANFDEESQTFSAYAYQNGNASVKNEQFIISLYRIVDNKPMRIVQGFSETFDFNGGDVAHIFKSRVIHKELLEKFDNSPNQYLLIDIINSEEIGNELYQIKLYYNTDTKKFSRPGFGGPPSPYQKEENIFIFEESDKTEYTIRTNFPIDDSHKSIAFNILMNQTAEVEYDIVITYSNRTIQPLENSDLLHQKLKIRIPKYNIARGMYGSSLAQFMDTNGLEFATYGDIVIKSPDLVYSNKYALEKYNLVQNE